MAVAVGAVAGHLVAVPSAPWASSAGGAPLASGPDAHPTSESGPALCGRSHKGSKGQGCYLSLPRTSPSLLHTFSSAALLPSCCGGGRRGGSTGISWRRHLGPLAVHAISPSESGPASCGRSPKGSMGHGRLLYATRPTCFSPFFPCPFLHLHLGCSTAGGSTPTLSPGTRWRRLVPAPGL